MTQYKTASETSKLTSPVRQSRVNQNKKSRMHVDEETFCCTCDEIQTHTYVNREIHVYVIHQYVRTYLEREEEATFPQIPYLDRGISRSGNHVISALNEC